jgi:hypothetical protein
MRLGSNITRSLLCLLLFSTASSAFATCGERGGPGCRLPNGKCAGWAQADYCRAHPEAAEAVAPELDKGEKINPYLKRSLLAMPAATGAIVLQLEPAEMGLLDRRISAQPDPKPSRQEAARRLIAQALGRE